MLRQILRGYLDQLTWRERAPGRGKGLSAEVGGCFGKDRLLLTGLSAFQQSGTCSVLRESTEHRQRWHWVPGQKRLGLGRGV